MADRNGWGIVYHCSDCGDNYVRMYGLGGDAPGSACDTWGLTSHAIRYIHEHPEKNHTLEDLLALEIVDGYEVVKAGVIDAYHWVDENACNLAITALVTMAVVAAFGPEQPEGAATSTTLSLMAEPILWIEDKAAKAVVVKAMTEIIADAFLLIPEVSNSIDHSLLDNIISNCLAESLKRTELWATPAGVSIAIGAAFAPVIADLICKKTCPQGFTKAFGA